jgi:uncharacterized membrane protein YfcA
MTWVVLASAAVLVGLAKTSFGGLGTVAVALFASVMPARESTAALLLVLLVGDVVAVSAYGRDCDWRLVGHLLPGVLPGLAIGAGVLAVVDDGVLRFGIGIVLLLLVLLQLRLMRRSGEVSPRNWPAATRAATGVGAGFTTMVANAAGPVMTLYLVGQGVDKRSFLGTTAWFFLCVNLAKLPIAAGLGLLHAPMLWHALVLAPLVVAGAWAGLALVRRIRQRTFDIVVLLASAVSAAALIVR